MNGKEWIMQDIKMFISNWRNSQASIWGALLSGHEWFLYM